MQFRVLTSAKDARAELINLIEDIGGDLSEEDSHDILLDAFRLIERRLGIRYEVSYSTHDERNAK